MRVPRRDWLALYVHDQRGLSQGLAATYTTYSITSTFGRLTGGFVVDRLGRLAVLRISGLLTCGAIAVVSTLGYGAFLIAPPLVGLIADRASLGCVMVLVLGSRSWPAGAGDAVTGARARP